MAVASAAMAAALTEPPVGATQTGLPASALTKRIASAAVMLPLALAALWFGGSVFLVLVGGAALLMLREWLRFADILPKPVPLVLLWLPLALALAMVEERDLLAAGVLALLFAVLLAAALRKNMLWAVSGAAYVGLPCLCLVWLRSDLEQGRLIVFWLLAVVWATDTGAYAFGRVIGGPKLIPAISPNKTWAGLLGGMCCAAAVGYGVTMLEPGLPGARLALFAATVAVVSQAGDFFESGVKRHFGRKDSGSLIPGHGGVLDRLDGVLFAAPFVAICLVFWGHELWP